MLPQSAEDGAGIWREIADLALQAESGGADSLWVCDHLFYRRPDGAEVGIVEGWTLLAALAAVTERVQLGTVVLATSYRSPGLLAKMAVALDDVAAGRLILGIGCGWYEPEYRAFGFPFDHRVGRFEEALIVLRRLLRGERVTFEGRWTALVDAAVLPPPARSIPLLVAADGDRMLRITAAHADAWQIAWFGRPDATFRGFRDRLIAACEQGGRDPATIEQMVGLNVDERDESGRLSATSLPLDAAAIADGLAAWAGEGVGHVQLGVHPMTAATFAVALDGINRFRASRSSPAVGSRSSPAVVDGSGRNSDNVTRN